MTSFSIVESFDSEWVVWMSVFKAYDIRGIAGDELDVDFSERLGKAIATH